MADLDALADDQAIVHSGGVIAFGTQLITISGEEVRIYGERLMDLPEIKRMLRIFELVLARHGRLFVLLIAGKVRAAPSPEVRRCIAEWGRQHRVSGVALVGGSAVIRAMVSLTARAIAIIRQHSLPATFVETEAEARLWFDELRRTAAA